MGLIVGPTAVRLYWLDKLSFCVIFTDSRQLAAAIAFSLALFSHIINHAVIRLQSALYELESPRKILEVESGGLT